jgi:D-alanyl-D-alanine carboxypeptidase
MNKINTILILFILLLSACANQEPTATPEPETAVPPTTAPEVEEETETAVSDEEMASLPDDIVAQLDDFLQSQVYTDGADPSTAAPGLVLLVDSPDGQYLQATGVASLEDTTPVQVDDRFEIGSNSKSFTIVLLMQLQEEGVLSMDDSLSDWLPEWTEKIPNGDQMTLRQLAQHTSGIWDYGDPIIGEAANNPDKLEQGYTPEELVQYAIDNGTPDFAPGEEGEWNYSNSGYILLGMIAEKAAGDSLENLLQARIFEPLGMESASLILGVPESGEIVDGYWWQDDGTRLNTTNWNVSQGWAAGGIAMTAEDLLTYGKALAAGELFQDPDSLTQMLTFNPAGMDGAMPYGLGLMDFSNVGASGSWGHAGQTAGFQSLWFTNPDTAVTVVGLSNSASYSAFSFLTVAGMLATNETVTESAVTSDKEPALAPGFIWNWASVTDPVNGETVIEPGQGYTFSLIDDEQFIMVATCRAAVGQYTLEDNALTLTFDVPDKLDENCEEDEKGERYFQLMQNAALYFIEDGRLYIDLMADAGTLAFDLGQVINSGG